MVYAASQLPKKVDLRRFMPSVEDQSEAASSTGNAMAAIYEYLNCRVTGRLVHFSPLFIYYNSRVKDNQGDKNIVDDGATITSTIETMARNGVCPEEAWPYDFTKVNTHPRIDCVAVGTAHKISEAFELHINVNEMKCCLAQGLPILVSLNLYESFGKAGSHGIVPMPTSDEIGSSKNAPHAVVLVGYSDRSKAFIVRNSWGSDWGDDGYCYIPYDYIGNDKLCTAAWTIKKAGIANTYQDAWENKDDVNYLDGGDEDDEDDEDEFEFDYRQEKEQPVNPDPDW
ncbi:unnamed protein product [Adineta steineri]|uniref:Peptidase C1A papain C-terminal domain-containing protein n=1 Tax=Adineta steineri TaxID=433720 RepID=A0A819SYW3_9BILA|nr:unnamed protein product [Adineta steineri]CAF1396607.1 unnamed protein product [Adineta steineri]CAF4031288.1 unnamed protein product [Adineta steineri]CAF4067769.1 unnamed protein product [Adineta steineri]